MISNRMKILGKTKANSMDRGIILSISLFGLIFAIVYR